MYGCVLPPHGGHEHKFDEPVWATVAGVNPSPSYYVECYDCRAQVHRSSDRQAAVNALKDHIASEHSELKGVLCD